MRNAAVIAAVAVCTACASGAAYSPRPFPKARIASGPSSAPVHMPAPATVPAPTSGPAISSPAVAAPAATPATTRGGGTDAVNVRATLSSAVVTTALALRGIPYRLGGADLNGFDCSGLVQYVMRQHGMDMPRTVIEQFDIGAPTSSIETGDLVFFQTIGSKASHVGIAIDAESFVHAPNTRGVVRVERLDASYWSSRFLGARRIF